MFFLEVESLVDSFGLSAGDWSLFVRGRREGRRAYLPMSLPSPECFSAAHLLWADIRAGAGRASSPRELLLSGSQVGVMPLIPLLKKWSL